MTINLIHLKEKIAISDNFTPEERDLILAALNLGTYADQHEYPRNFGPDHPSAWVRLSWKILDQINPEAMSLATRWMLGGMLAGALSEMYKQGQEGKPASKKSFRRH